jgi:hypothetical protein
MRHLLTVAAILLASVVANGQTIGVVAAKAPIYLDAKESQTPLRVADVGTRLKVLQDAGDWTEVEFQDPQWGARVGWIRTDQLQITRPQNQPTDTAPPTDAVVARPAVPTPAPDSTRVFQMPAGVERVIAEGLKLKGRGTGLALTDAGQGFVNALTAFADGMNHCPGCTATKSGFSVVVFTPLTWIEWQASQAAKEYRPFDLSMVTEDMAAPVLRVRVNPDIPSHVTARGLAGTSSVQHVVLRCGQKRTVIQPLNKSTFLVEVKNAMGGNAQYEGVEAIFPLDGVALLRGPGGDKEFFVTVVGTGYEKNFKIKQKHFKQLPM